MVKEQVQVEDKAIRYIAKVADGSMRDALSLLDQCIAFHLGETLTYDNVLEVLGAVDTDVFSRLLRDVLDRNVAGVLDTVDELIMQGRELSQLAGDFTWYLRNLLLAKTSECIEDVLDVSSENMIQLQQEAQMIEMDALLRYIRIFSELSGKLRFATQKRVMLEVALIKLCIPAMETNEDSMLERIRAVEEKVEAGAMALPATEKIVYVGGEGAAKPEPKPELPKAIPDDIKEVVKNFRSIADETSGMVRTMLKKAKLSLGGDDKLQIVLPDALEARAVGTQERREEIEALIAAKIGKTVTVDVRQVEESRHFEDSFVDIEKLINMEIVTED